LDYNVWKSSLGSTNPAADGNSDGIVDAADYVVWRKNLMAHRRSGSAATASNSGLHDASHSAVPEPGAWQIIALGGTSVCATRRWRLHRRARLVDRCNGAAVAYRVIEVSYHRQ